MLTIEIVTSSRSFRMSVEQVQFIRTCPHCDVEFQTIDPDQIYPSPSHRMGAFRIRRIVAESHNAPVTPQH